MSSLLVKKNNILIFAASLAVMLFIGIVIAGLFARPIADDLAYLQVYQYHGSVIGASLDQYMNHSGRLSQVTLVYIFYALFGDAATRVAPLLLLVAASAAFALLIFLLVDKSNKDRLIMSIIGGVLLSSAIFITIPSLFDSLYWLTSSTVYVTSLIGLVLTTALLVSIFKYTTWDKPSKLFIILPFIILMQSFGESGAVISIAMSGAAVFWTLIDHKKRHLFSQNLIVFSGLMIGFLINYLSPGTTTRRAINQGSSSIAELMSDTINSLLTMFSYVEWWHIVLATMVSTLIFIVIPKEQRQISKKQAIKTTLITAVCLLIIFAITFGISAISVGQYFAIRNYTVPSAALFIGIIIFGLTALRVLDTVAKGFVFKLSLPLLIATVLASVPFTVNKQVIHIRAMSIRDLSYSQRELSIKKQLDNKVDPIKVQPVQVTVSPSEAADLQNPNLPQVDWVVRMIESHYEIPGFVIIKSSANDCVPNSKYVRYDLSCDYTFTHND